MLQRVPRSLPRTVRNTHTHTLAPSGQGSGQARLSEHQSVGLVHHEVFKQPSVQHLCSAILGANYKQSIYSLCSSGLLQVPPPPTFLSLLESLSTADKSLAEIVRKYRFHILDYLGRRLGRYTRWVILAEHFLICRVWDF